MNIEQTKKLLKLQIDSGQVTQKVWDVIKTDKESKQAAYDTTAELFKPAINIQKEVKKNIDKRQDELIQQFQTKSKTDNK